MLRLFARSHRERGQSLTEYGLILALLVVAMIAVLGMVGSAVSGQLDSVTSALGAEGGKSAFAVLPALPPWIAIGVLVIGGVGLYLLKMRRG